MMYINTTCPLMINLFETKKREQRRASREGQDYMHAQKYTWMGWVCVGVLATAI
uniref:Uncharacterized protein n=1 Tax=Arundo donax TaxID=35708 RepID=A0A0A9FKP9_ARUDO